MNTYKCDRCGQRGYGVDMHHTEHLGCRGTWFQQDSPEKKDAGSHSALDDGLVAMQAEAKLFVDANVWDGEDRSGATNDRATFSPDELQELINDMLEHMSN